MKTNQENMPGWRAGIANIIPKESPLTIIDIGASLVGDELPKYQGLIEAGCAKLVAFEPDETALKTLKEKYPLPHLCLPHFIGDGKAATFFETNWSPTGSLFEPNTALLEKFHNLANLTTLVKTHQVETTRLDDIKEIVDADFIKIDAQGSERMIFENAENLLKQVTLIQTEVSWVEMYKGMPLFADIDRVLRGMGFQWHTRLGCGYRSFLPFLNPDNPHAAFRQELWSNVVYVRDWMHFDRISHDKLVKLAVLLHDLYESYDLAHLALAAADAKSGTNYAANYAEWLSEESPEHS
jgi:FkbM family methyltransferase